MLIISLVIWFTPGSVRADENDLPTAPLSHVLAKSTVAALGQRRITTWAELRRRYLKEGPKFLSKIPGLGVKGERAMRATAEFNAICRGTRLDPAHGPLNQSGLSPVTVINLENHGIWSERELRELYRTNGWRAILMIEGLADLGRSEIRRFLQRPGAECEPGLAKPIEAESVP